MSKGGGKVGFSKNPKIGKLDIFKERYKCYTFLETSGQAQKGGKERKIKKGQENKCYGLEAEKKNFFSYPLKNFLKKVLVGKK